jgi:hypothetical protein
MELHTISRSSLSTNCISGSIPRSVITYMRIYHVCVCVYVCVYVRVCVYVCVCVYVNKVKSPDLVLRIGNINKKTMTCILCNSITMTYWHMGIWEYDI